MAPVSTRPPLPPEHIPVAQTPREALPLVVSTYIDLFPDVTVPISYLLHTPFLRDTDLFKRVTKNIDAIYLTVVIVSVATNIFAAIGIYYSAAGILHVTFAYIHISSIGTACTFGGSYIKKYFLLKLNHDEIELVRTTIDALHERINALGRELHEFRSQNERLDQTREALEGHLAAQIEAHRASVENFEDIISRQRDTNQQLETRNTELVAIRDNLNRDLQTLQTTAGSLQTSAARLEQLQTVVATLERQEAQSRASITTQEEVLVALREETAAMQAERVRHQEILDAVHAATLALTNRIAHTE